MLSIFFLYVLNYPIIQPSTHYSLSKRERERERESKRGGCTHARIARLKTVPTIKNYQELVSHPMSECMGGAWGGGGGGASPHQINDIQLSSDPHSITLHL